MDLGGALWLALWIGFFGAVFALVGVWLFGKALVGDITFREACLTCLPLAVCYLLIFAARGTFFVWIFGACALAYAFWIATQRTAEQRQMEQLALQRDHDRWRDAVLTDDHNAGAHLFLGHALVKMGDLEGAAEQYDRALALDPVNVRELLSFLAGRAEQEVTELRRLLPDLEALERQVRRRDSYRGDLIHTESHPHVERDRGGLTHLEPLRSTLAIAAPAGQVPAEPNAVPENAHREYFGETEDEVEHGTGGRLSELRQLLDINPDDPLTRLAYAEALEEAGEIEAARAEYQRVAREEPENEPARAALARLEGAEESAPPAEEPPNP